MNRYAHPCHRLSDYGAPRRNTSVPGGDDGSMPLRLRPRSKPWLQILELQYRTRNSISGAILWREGISDTCTIYFSEFVAAGETNGLIITCDLSLRSHARSTDPATHFDGSRPILARLYYDPVNCIVFHTIQRRRRKQARPAVASRS